MGFLRRKAAALSACRLGATAVEFAIVAPLFLVMVYGVMEVERALWITPHCEGLAAVIWHLMVSHPALKIEQTKWESLA